MHRFFDHSINASRPFPASEDGVQFVGADYWCRDENCHRIRFPVRIGPLTGNHVPIEIVHHVAPVTGACVLFGASSLIAAKLPDGFVETRIAGGLNPTTMTFAPDGRLFLCEKQGLLRVVAERKLLDSPALDLTRVVDGWNERGLLSICVDSEFSRNGWF